MNTQPSGSAGAIAKAAFSFDEFCSAHGLSRAMLYKMIRASKGPRVMKVGTRSLISAEAAADWRRAMEAAS